jgi:GDPmannose 4,6-dehydratase
VREFLEVAFDHAGLDYRKFVRTDPAFLRPAEVDILLGNAAKAEQKLGWRRRVGFEDLVREMVDYDCSLVRQSTPALQRAVRAGGS